MKNRTLLSIAAILFTATAFAQTPIQEWAARYDYSGNTDVFLDMTQDAAGNTYVCGYSDNASTGTDIVVAKYALDGIEQWTYRYNDPQVNGEDKAVAIALTNNNDVVVAGHSERVGTAKDFITILISGNTGQEMSGWPQFVDGPVNDNDWANDVAVRQSDNLIAVCGAYTDNYLRKGLVTYAPSGAIDWIGNQWSPNNDDSYNLFCEFFNNGALLTIEEIIEDGCSNCIDTGATYSIINVDNGQYWASHEGFDDDAPNTYFSYLHARDLTMYNNTAYLVADWRQGNTTYGYHFAVYGIL